MARTGMVIAIDGPAGAGKSTVARAVAAALGFDHLDTGAIYRAITLKALEAGVGPDDGPGLAALCRGTEVSFTGGRLHVDGTPPGEAIRTRAVSAAVSEVSAHPEVRAELVDVQRRAASDTGLVAEGRDIGTVVFPDASVKVFLVASIDERARRRLAELRSAGVEVDAATIRAEIAARDASDAGRTASPLLRAADAHEVDTTALSPEEVVARIVALVERIR